MNQRIRELAQQANPDIFKEFDQEDIDFCRKFAQLIIQECIDVVSPYAIRMENFDGGHPITDLKKHFGVK